MVKPLSAKEMCDRELPEIRCRLIDIAAALDRIERGANPHALRDDPRLERVQQALRVLADGKGDRADRVQRVFSDPYDPNWREIEAG